MNEPREEQKTAEQNSASPPCYACYDCAYNNENPVLHKYYDAQFGELVAYTCKACGLTNEIDA
jgi:hypothetical protein